MTPKFGAGRIVATPGATAALDNAGIPPSVLLNRHTAGDWGALGPADRKLNQQALQDGGRLFSAYVLPDQTNIWVITEAADDQGRRVSTCLLLPSEY